MGKNITYMNYKCPHTHACINNVTLSTQYPFTEHTHPHASLQMQAYSSTMYRDIQRKGEEEIRITYICSALAMAKLGDDKCEARGDGGEGDAVARGRWKRPSGVPALDGACVLQCSPEMARAVRQWGAWPRRVEVIGRGALLSFGRGEGNRPW